jgi:hypothetical protein
MILNSLNSTMKKVSFFATKALTSANGKGGLKPGSIIQNLSEVPKSLPLPMGGHHSTLYQNFINSPVRAKFQTLDVKDE